MTLRDKLISALTQWDMRQSKTRFYNPHALGIYFERAEEVMADIDKGTPPRDAIIAGFNDRLRDYLLKQVGEATTTKTEAQTGGYVYQPVSR